MLKKAVLFAERESPTNIRTQVMNAEHLPLADQTFDAVISRFGLTFLDYHKALSESLRVLRPKRKRETRGRGLHPESDAHSP